ncbi:MAG: hypothetical protein WKF47_13160, partial [Geodermatophilaceae bacterium]
LHGPPLRGWSAISAPLRDGGLRAARSSRERLAVLPCSTAFARAAGLARGSPRSPPPSSLVLGIAARVASRDLARR